MKKILTLIVLFVIANINAQEVEPTYEKAGDMVKATYYYQDGSIKEQGFFKDNIKLTFSYELLLRLTHNNVKIMSIPKVGYQHVNFREDSLFFNLKNEESNKLSEKEVKFWMDTAKKEFFFKNKRDVNYTEA